MPKNIHRFLGIPLYRFGVMESEDRVGVATGLAWTEVGGEILSIEVSVMQGKGQLNLTGKLGDVMKESAQAGFSYVRSRAESLGVDPDFHEKYKTFTFTCRRAPYQKTARPPGSLWRLRWFPP